MAEMALSRWPTLRVGQADEKCVDAYLLEAGNIGRELAKLAKDCGVDLEHLSNRDEIKVGKREGIPILFLIAQPQTLGRLAPQRNLFNKLVNKFALSDFKPFLACNIHVHVQKFKAESLDSLLSGLYEFSVFKEETFFVKEIFISGISDEDVAKVKQVAALYSWVFFARDLVNYPPSLKSPRQLAEKIKEQLSGLNVSAETYTEQEVKDNFDPVWRVGQASSNKPEILRLEYKPENAKNTKPIVLIGKGVVYDVGGHNIKTEGSDMKIMKLDMAGAAAVASVCGLAATLELPIHLIIYMPFVENMVGPYGLKPGDIVRVPASKEPKDKSDWYFIEVTDTDAEGRLLLSSVIGHTSLHDEPGLIVTVATLCSTTESMLGYLVAAAMSRTKTLLDDIESAGRVTGEVYSTVRLNNDVIEEYLDDYESTVADFQNTNWDIPIGDSLQAFCLIQHFAEDTPFLHLDICGTAYMPWAIVQKSKRNLPEGATGWGVASVFEFLKRYIKNGSQEVPA